jgi:hypothetical protein
VRVRLYHALQAAAPAVVTGEEPEESERSEAEGDERPELAVRAVSCHPSSCASTCHA